MVETWAQKETGSEESKEIIDRRKFGDTELESGTDHSSQELMSAIKRPLPHRPQAVVILRLNGQSNLWTVLPTTVL